MDDFPKDDESPGAKAQCLRGLGGTTEVVPFHKTMFYSLVK